VSNYSLYSRARRWPKRVIYTAIVLLLLFACAAFVLRWLYDKSLGPVSNDTTQKVFVIAPNSSVVKIGSDLYAQGLIRQQWVFDRYVAQTGLGSKLQAGTYRLSPSESTPAIASKFAEGKVAVDLIVLLPGQRLDQLKQAFIRANFDPATVDAAFDPAQYAGSPALAGLPPGASLEGFLYPDSYQKDATTNPTMIVRAALAEMAQHLTPEIRSAYAQHGLTVYQGVTMASIIEKEVSTQDDRNRVAQVFYSRMAKGMRLESDPTAYYGAILAGQKPSLSFSSPYNTYQVHGLPVGPISNMSDSSLHAVAFPAATDWLYFVAGDDGKTYFSKTLADHQALVAQYCKKLCSR
jgi:UPF0755 protein